VSAQCGQGDKGEGCRILNCCLMAAPAIISGKLLPALIADHRLAAQGKGKEVWIRKMRGQEARYYSRWTGNRTGGEVLDRREGQGTGQGGVILDRGGGQGGWAEGEVLDRGEGLFSLV
jgi:hypothetical protein